MFRPQKIIIGILALLPILLLVIAIVLYFNFLTIKACVKFEEVISKQYENIAKTNSKILAEIELIAELEEDEDKTTP